jgi:hypothetical protein
VQETGLVRQLLRRARRNYRGWHAAERLVLMDLLEDLGDDARREALGRLPGLAPEMQAAATPPLHRLHYAAAGSPCWRLPVAQVRIGEAEPARWRCARLPQLAPYPVGGPHYAQEGWPAGVPVTVSSRCWGVVFHLDYETDGSGPAWCRLTLDRKAVLGDRLRRLRALFPEASDALA